MFICRITTIFCFSVLCLRGENGVLSHTPPFGFSKNQVEQGSSIRDLSSKIQAFQAKLDAVDPSAASNGIGFDADPPSRSFSRFQEGGAVMDSLQASESPKWKDPKSSGDELGNTLYGSIPSRTSPVKVGFYVLPFVALQGSSDFGWNSFAGEITVEQKLGFSSGWRMGHKWRNFFLDADFSFFRNEFRGLTDVSLEFSGEAEGYGLMVNFGGCFDLGDSSTIFLGAGTGPFSQEFEFKLMRQGVDEEKSILAYQLFAGLNLHPTDHMIVGLRYRWMNLAKMNDFSGRELHLLELGLGYIF